MVRYLDQEPLDPELPISQAFSSGPPGHLRLTRFYELGSTARGAILLFQMKRTPEQQLRPRADAFL